jgi:CRP/FNR family cyclic AMP-dependent transcriptional regulator
MPKKKGVNPNAADAIKTQTDVEKKYGEVVKHLRDCRLFSELTEEQIRKLATVFEITDYKAGDVIFKQGDIGDRIYVIAHGLVNLERKVNMGDREAAVSVSFLGPCRLLGCWSCLLGEPGNHTESAVCHKPTRVITAKDSDLMDIFKTDLRITVTLLMGLCFMLGDKARSIYGALESL